MSINGTEHGQKHGKCLLQKKTVLFTRNNRGASTMNSLSPVLPSQVLCRLRQRSGCEQADCPPGNILVEQNCEREADLALAIVKIREWIMNSISIFNLKKNEIES